MNIFLPHHRPEPIWPLRAGSNDIDAVLLPILFGLAGAIVAILVALMIGPHGVELLLPPFGLLCGRLLSKFD